jgi:hypothetical protein
MTDLPVPTGVVVPADSGVFSDTCTSPTAKTIFDGFVESTYARLVTDQPSSPQALWVCFRVQRDALQSAGRLEIPAGGSAPIPTTDTNYSTCSTAPGNAIPGSHPMFSQTVAGLTQSIDSYASAGGDVWLCLRADPVGTRVVTKQPSGGGTPAVRLDSPPTGPPPPTPGPAGEPSTTCQNGSGNVRALNANLGGSQVWLYGWQESASKIHLCVRAQYPAQAPTQRGGGRLTVDTTGVPGATLVGPATSTDTSQCTVPIYHLSTQGVDITITSSPITPTPSNPAYLCVTSPSLPRPLVIYGGYTGSATAPQVTWRPDSGTPGGPIG